jgi:hypothetical protein
MDEVSEHVFIHQGDIPGELRVSNQARWYVTVQIWEGSKIIRTYILASFASKEEAEARLKEEIAARKKKKNKRATAA